MTVHLAQLQATLVQNLEQEKQKARTNVNSEFEDFTASLKAELQSALTTTQSVLADHNQQLSRSLTTLLLRPILYTVIFLVMLIGSGWSASSYFTNRAITAYQQEAEARELLQGVQVELEKLKAEYRATKAELEQLQNKKRK